MAIPHMSRFSPGRSTHTFQEEPDLMELRQLEYFMITCEKGSFNQAAECLYTTQYDVRQLQINNCEPFLLIGYICPEDAKLSTAAEWFIRHFQAIL